VYAYNNQITIIPSQKWSSVAGKNLKYQVRAMTTQGDSYILMAPRYTEEIKLKMPYTNNIYIDCLDAKGNYVTQFI
jgi:hypothetical protein